VEIMDGHHCCRAEKTARQLLYLQINPNAFYPKVLHQLARHFFKLILLSS
jgi:hypothetical protein